MPDVDLFLRPSGEQRISNFLLWQSAYAEFVFQEKLFPDFDRRDLWAACLEYAARSALRRCEMTDLERLSGLLAELGRSWRAMRSRSWCASGPPARPCGCWRCLRGSRSCR